MKIILNTLHPNTNYAKMPFCGEYGDIGGIYSSRDPGDFYFPDTSPESTSDGHSSSMSWSRSRLNIHNRNFQEMADLAEYFYEFSDDELKQVCSSAYWTPWGKKENYQKLLEAVKKVREHVSDTNRRLQQFEPYTKKSKKAENDQKRIVSQKFVSALGYKDSQLDKSNYLIPNIVILHGNTLGKEDFVSWLEERASEKYDVFWYDETRKKPSTKEIVTTLKDFATRCFDCCGELLSFRKVIYIGNMDEFLVPAKTKEDRLTQREFTEFLQGSAQKLHISVVGISNIKDAKQIEDALHNDKSLLVPLNIDIPETERPLYEKLYREKLRLKDKSYNVHTTFAIL